MTKYTGLQKRNNSYYYRVRVPKDLQETLNKNEVVISLKTSDKSEAISKLKLQAVLTQQKFDKLREQLKPLSGELAPDLTWEECESIVDSFIYKASIIDKDARLLKSDEVKQDREIIPYHKGLFDYCMFKLNNKLYYPEESISRLRFEATYHRKYLELVEVLKERDKGNYKLDIKKPDNYIETLNPININDNSITLENLISKFYLAPERVNIEGSSKLKYDLIFKALTEVVGKNRPIESITREDCRTVRDIFIKLPTNATRQYPTLTLKKVSDLDLPNKLSTKSINNYLMCLSSLFRWAVKEDYIDKNVAQSLQVSTDSKSKTKRDPFSIEQLNKIFSSELYQNKENTGMFWIPLLSLFTGMRMNECCQLVGTDFEEEKGILYLKLSDKDKQLKTLASNRIIPIHSELIRIGFKTYIDSIKDKKIMIFPELTKAATGYYSDNFSKKFQRYLKKIDAKTPKTSFHSFRHNFRDALRNAGIAREIAQALGGWEGDGKTDLDYGSGYSVEVLYKHLSKIKYDGLDLSILY